MRKAGAWLLAAVLSLTLCACGQKARPTVGLGRFSGEQVSVYGGDWQPVSEVYSGPTYLALNAGGEGVFCVDGEAAEVGWATSGGELTLTMGSARCEGTIDANTIEIGFFDADIRMKFSRPDSAALLLPDSLPEQAQDAAPDENAEPDTDAAPDYAAYWAGDWYGWHVITDASEELQYLEDTAWDACARIRVRDAAGRSPSGTRKPGPASSCCGRASRFSPARPETGA